MNLRPSLASVLAAAVGLALGACGGSLYDAAGVPKVDANGCDLLTQHVCPGVDTTCRSNTDALHCGDASACTACTAAPASGAPACVPQAGGGFGCGFSCVAPARQCGIDQCLPESVDACGPTCELCPAGPAGSTRSCDLGVGGVRHCGVSCVAPARFCPVRNACLADTVTACGPSCQDCTASAPAGATATCSAPTVGGANACGFACAAGFLPVGGACERPTSVAAGGHHSCALTSSGGLVCWGANDAGQLGVAGAGGPAPRTVYASGVTAVAAGGQHTCAVHGGVLSCWGANGSGQLGVTGGPGPVPVPLSGVTQLAAGGSHTCAVTAAGAVRCWGANAKGQLGFGDLSAHPFVLATPVTSGAAQVAAFADTSCAIVTSGAPAVTDVTCWGANEAGQTGRGTSGAAAPTPARVGLLAAPLLVAVGANHACANVVGLGLYCWGSNAENQLGAQAPPANTTVPVRADKLDRNGVAGTVAAGDRFTCVGRAAAIEVGMTCAGRTDLGQAGIVSATPVVEGTAAFAAHPVIASSGADHTCALVDLGTTAHDLEIDCWGSNASGQLGRTLAGGATFTAAPAVVGP